MYEASTLRHLLRRALGHDDAAALAAFGPEVDDPVGALDDVEVVLDDEHGVARVHQAAAARASSLRDVLEVQARGGLVEHVEGAGRSARLPSSRLSFTRCASPPRSVGAGCPIFM